MFNISTLSDVDLNLWNMDSEINCFSFTSGDEHEYNTIDRNCNILLLYVGMRVIIIVRALVVFPSC